MIENLSKNVKPILYCPYCGEHKLEIIQLNNDPYALKCRSCNWRKISTDKEFWKNIMLGDKLRFEEVKMIIEPEVISKIKERLQEYWVNDVKMPMSIMLHSFALIDMVLDEEGLLKSSNR